MLLPGIGEGYVPARVRLLLAFSVSLVVYFAVSSHLPSLPSSFIQMCLFMFAEILIGLFIGMIGRMLLGVMHTAGMIMAYQSGLAQSILFDANSGVQGSTFGNFMTLVAVVLIFATNMHHLILYGLSYSYSFFTAGAFIDMADVATFGTKVMESSFLTAIMIAGPHIVVGLIAYLGAGVMARLMPNMQIFFVMIPLQILVGFFIFMVTFSAGMMWFMGYFKDTMSSLLGG